jgi:hypothetical protein
MSWNNVLPGPCSSWLMPMQVRQAHLPATTLLCHQVRLSRLSGSPACEC